MKKKSNLIDYILLRSLNLASSSRRVSLDEIVSLVKSSEDGETLNLISDFCVLDGSAHLRPIGNRALRMAVRRGFPSAIYTCAKDSKNPKRAYALYRKGAKKGDPWSALNAGWCCFNGVGTKKSTRMAKRFYLQASRHKLASALYNLGLIYLEGNVKRAQFYFRRAVKLGHARSMLILAKLLIRDERRFSPSVQRLLDRAHSLGEPEAGDILRMKRRITRAISKDRRTGSDKR